MFHQRTKELSAGRGRRSLNDGVEQLLRALSLCEKAVHILAGERGGERLRFTFGFRSTDGDSCPNDRNKGINCAQPIKVEKRPETGRIARILAPHCSGVVIAGSVVRSA